MQIWSSLPSGVQMAEAPSCHPQSSSTNLLQLNIRASDEDQLDPTSTQRNLYSVLTRARSTREKKQL